MFRWEIINLLVKNLGFRSYLEIGARERHCFDRIECAEKKCVDPAKEFKYDFNMTSDEFFSVNSDTFDIIFIDGFHSAEQAEKDIYNSLGRLNEGGRIVLHDCNPPNREFHDYKYCGTVWKAVYRMRVSRDDVSLETVDCDFGVGIIKKEFSPKIKDFNPYMDVEVFETTRRETLNLVSPEEFASRYR